MATLTNPVRPDVRRISRSVKVPAATWAGRARAFGQIDATRRTKNSSALAKNAPIRFDVRRHMRIVKAAAPGQGIQTVRRALLADVFRTPEVGRAAIGTGTISGTTSLTGFPPTPLSQIVRVYSERFGHLVAHLGSDLDSGAFSVPRLSVTQTFTVVAYDHTGQYRAEIWNGVKPV